jgi:uncharacterized membrane protein
MAAFFVLLVCRLVPSFMAFALFAIGFLVYFSAASLRHVWLQSSAWDLGIFDQAVYLIGSGLRPESSFLGFHIIGDHGALVLYPLGLISRWFPSPWSLFVLQAAALASVVFPLAQLARLRGLGRAATGISLAVVLLYPVVFNTVIFDFHPEVFAFPLVMQCIFLLERRDAGGYAWVVLNLFLALTCKLSLFLLVLGFSVNALVWRRWWLACVLALEAIVWFLVVGGWLIPAFGGSKASIWRQASKFGLGASGASGMTDLRELIAASIQLVHQIFTGANFFYLLLILVPVLYVLLNGRRWAFFRCLLPAAPLIFVNLIAAILPMKDLVHHYSLMLVPFIASGVQLTLAPGELGLGAYPSWFQAKAPYLVLGWSVLTFVSLSRLAFFFGPLQDRLDLMPALGVVSPMVRPQSDLLTSNHLAPHFSHRRLIEIVGPEAVKLDVDRYQQVLLDHRHPGWNASPELLSAIRDRLMQSGQWSLRFDQGGLWLFEHRRADSDRVGKFRQQ